MLRSEVLYSRICGVINQNVRVIRACPLIQGNVSSMCRELRNSGDLSESNRAGEGLESCCWPPTYIATVTYGKEGFAELEIGDALFSLDPEVNICRTPYRGVLLVKTSLTEDTVSRLLSVNPPSTLRRFMRVLFCCERSELTKCLDNNVAVLTKNYFGSLRVSERSGVSYEDVVKLLNMIGYQLNRERDIILSVEPFRNFICFTKQLLTFKKIS